MNKFTKVIAAVMLMIAVVMGCTKQDEPNNGGNNNGQNDTIIDPNNGGGNNGTSNECVLVTTYTPQDITETTVKCGGDVILLQVIPLSELGICWSKESNPTIDDSFLATTNWASPFVCTITDLEPNTNYHIRAFARRGLVCYYGEDKSFTTATGEFPIVTTAGVTNITKNTATCGGCVDSDGGFPIIEKGICWSINTNPTMNDSYIDCGTGLGSFVVDISGLVQNTMYYVRAYAKNICGVSYGAQVSFTTLNPPPVGTYNGHDYIDLGLPSGTLWATCNVGATIPEIIGDYFAWGETESKTIYNWNTYKYCVVVGEAHYFTKYCSSHGYNGFADTLTVLQPIDDAAVINWGDGWRMPSVEEWVELYQNTRSIKTIQNGVYGELFNSDNGNSLFLPATGEFFNNSINDDDLCLYWINKVSDDSGSARCYCNQNPEHGVIWNASRMVGYPVRPICIAQ